MTAPLPDLAFRRAVERLHDLGPRPLYHLLDAIGAERLCRTRIEQLVVEFAAIPPDVLKAVGGDRLPPLPPLREVA